MDSPSFLLYKLLLTLKKVMIRRGNQRILNVIPMLSAFSIVFYFQLQLLDILYLGDALYASFITLSRLMYRQPLTQTLT